MAYVTVPKDLTKVKTKVALNLTKRQLECFSAAAVVGVPHPKWEETPIAVVALEDGADVTADALISFARDRLAHFKCPTRVEYVAELPRNATGKVLKKDLRKQFGGDESAVHR